MVLFPLSWSRSVSEYQYSCKIDKVHLYQYMYARTASRKMESSHLNRMRTTYMYMDNYKAPECIFTNVNVLNIITILFIYFKILCVFLVFNTSLKQIIFYRVRYNVHGAVYVSDNMFLLYYGSYFLLTTSHFRKNTPFVDQGLIV